MVGALGHPDVYLWNSGNQPASGVLDWNCHSACLANSVRRDLAFIFAFQCHGIGAVLWQLLLALLYGIVGIYMLMNPLLGVISLTLVLAVFLLFEGILELALYFRIRRIRHAGWVLFDGIVTLILGIFIWAQWPSSSVWVIGTLVGISLIFSGISRFMLSLAVRRLSTAS